MSELKQRKKTVLSSAFMSYGLTLIALGAFVLIQTVSFVFSWDILLLLVTLNNSLTIGAFVFKTKEKKTLSTVFAILSMILPIFIVVIAFVNGPRYHYDDWVQIISYLFLHVLLVLFVMLPETPIKSFFTLFPVIVLLAEALMRDPFYTSFYFSSIDTLLLYILGFSMTTPMATSAPKPVKKNAGVAIEKLESLAKLKERGILTDEEFETKKAEIMQML